MSNTAQSSSRKKLCSEKEEIKLPFHGETNANAEDVNLKY